MSNLRDLTGRRFGMLTVVQRGPNGHTRGARWICRCDCGGISIVWSRNLVRDDDAPNPPTRSCGCRRWAYTEPKAGKAAWQREYVKDRYLNGKRHRPIVGFKRRAEALQAMGWSLRSIGAQLGWRQSRLSHVLRTQKYVHRDVDEKMRGLYDELWNRPPTVMDGYQVGWVTRNRNRAVKLGYAPPGAWDDDTIDDPEAKPWAPKRRTA